jgi:dihydroorotase
MIIWKSSKTNQKNVAGIKIFLGSSTGNMLVEATLEKYFRVHQCLLLFIVKMKLLYKNNLEKYKAEYGEDVPVTVHHYP